MTLPERVEFQAPEYHGDGTFRRALHGFVRESSSGWKVFRDGALQESLGEGYVLVRPLLCGICATDLTRRHLPFPLPQIIGHEVVALHEEKPVVVEINASHAARGLDTSGCSRCREGMPSHCPGRVTLGINRLPGGFAPYMLAPVRGIIPVSDSLSARVAVFVEPFSAALHAVETTPPDEGEEVAVLGPRRLGLLLVAALERFRRETGRRFRITAVLRHAALAQLCTELGADRIIDVAEGVRPDLQASFHTVFDTSGTPEGFSLSLFLAGRRVHLKSTHGRPAGGLSRLTDMVVDEIALMPYTVSRLAQFTPASPGPGIRVYLAPSLAASSCNEISALPGFRCVTDAGPRAVSEGPVTGVAGEVDVAVVTSLKEVDALMDRAGQGKVRLRPRGTILLAGPVRGREATALEEALSRGIEIHTSRCGSLQRGIETLSASPELGRLLETRLITHTFSLDDIGEAFRVAADSRRSIKVLVETGA